MSICDVRWKSMMWCCVYQGDIGAGYGKKKQMFHLTEVLCIPLRVATLKFTLT